MKKMITGVVAVAFWFSSLSPASALLRKDFSAVEGPVIAKNERTKEITVRHGEEPRVFLADDQQFASVKVGDEVLLMHHIEEKAISTIVVTKPKQ